jgi:alkylhydroperoxidase family enzyme
LDINAFRGMQEGLTEAQIDNVAHFEQSDLYSHRERIALRYAERVTVSEQDVDDELFGALLTEFESPACIVELTAIVAFENFRSKFNHALLVESNGVCLLQSAPAK